MKKLIIILSFICIQNGFSQISVDGLFKKATKAVKDKAEKVIKKTTSSSNSDSQKSNSKSSSGGSGGSCSELQKNYDIIFSGNGKMGLNTLRSVLFNYKLVQDMEEFKANLENFDSNYFLSNKSTFEECGFGYEYNSAMDDINSITEEDYTNNIKKNVNSQIDIIYKLKKKNENESGLQELQKLKIYVDAFRKVKPNFTIAKTQFSEVDKMYEKFVGADKASKTKAMTSDFHSKNVNKILFSTKPIVVGEEKASDFTTEFKPSDNIYATIYLSKGISEYGVNDLVLKKDEENEKMKVVPIFTTFDNDNENRLLADQAYSYHTKQTLRYQLTKEDVEKNVSVIQMEILVSKDQAKTLNSYWFSKAAQKLSPRGHEITMNFGDVSAYDKSPKTPVGTFSIDCSEYDFQVLEKEHASLKLKLDQNKPLAEDFFSFNRKSMSNVSPEKMKQFALSYLNKEYGKLKVANITAIQPQSNTTDTEWVIFQNEFNIPVVRRSHPIGVTFKGNDGNCYYSYFTLQQGYSGGGTYGQVVLDSDQSTEPRMYKCK
jgi:hypothetical protein